MALAKTGGTSDSNDLTYEPCLSRGREMPSRSMQVTIALLPVSLSLVHIPRSRLDSLSQVVVRQLLHPSSTFLNITCNEIELSLFAEHHTLDAFEHIARKDSQRSRSSSSSSRKTSFHHAPTFEPVEISYDRWSVLQVDSHSDQIGDTSGTRVYDLSGPLAAAGISILYQSSYTSDFIFVKESRLQEAMSLFSASGFDLYAADPHSPSSPLYSPVTDDCGSVDFTPASCPRAGAVMTYNVGEVSAKNRSNSVSSVTSQVSKSSRMKSHSPTAGEVRILSPDLVCVGLSDEVGIDHWGLKIIKLIAFPDLIPVAHSAMTKSLTFKRKSVTIPIPTSRLHSPLDPSLDNKFLVKSYSSSENSSSTSSDEDGYFSHSPQNVSTSLPTTHSSYSQSDLSLTPGGFKSASKHPLSSSRATFPAFSVDTKSSHNLPAPKSSSKVPFFSFTRTTEGSSLTADVNVLAVLFPPKERHMVICGDELDAADLRLERKRYKPDVYSSDDEDDGDSLFQQSKKMTDLDLSRSPSRNGDKSTSSSYKCLQIDLRGFGLDKYGLVNRFSRVLEENGINHMYSSTFKTANLLVDKKDAIRAQSLLRSC